MMGASLCKSIKKNKISKKITGFDKNPKSLDYALKNKIIDYSLSKIIDIDHPDLIILCTPVSSYEKITLKLSKMITKKSILTDIGSSKGDMHNIKNENKLFKLSSDGWI